jgi:signal peptidase I
MPFWVLFILDVAIFWFFFGNNVVSLLRTKHQKARAELKHMAKHLRDLRLRNADLLTERQEQGIAAALDDIQAALKAGPADVAAMLKKLSSPKSGYVLPSPPSCRWCRENLETIVISLGIAFAVRSLFIQPFKIPTGSMQPTLYGIHFIAEEQPYQGKALQKFFSYLNFSRRHCDIVLQSDGRPESLRPLPSPPFFPKTQLTVGQSSYVLPAAPIDVQKALLENVDFHENGGWLKKGQVLLRGAFESGDHLFVNRLSLCFAEPRRGDVMVFKTDGLYDADGTGFGGSYYIKRLVGLPGDELLLKDRKLYVRPQGASEFRLLDAQDDPGFARLYSFQGGYHGYAHAPGAQYLRHNSDTVTVPAGHYFMLGDNSENSKDSRYWGFVPRENLIGTPCFVWWPFSRRFGTVDRVEPLPVPTPPNFPILEE